jgi:hypothetical protein
MATMALALLALLAPAQAPKQPAQDLFGHRVKAPGIEVRFVDYHWQPALFEAMEKGTGDIPEANRNWVIARIVLDKEPLTLEGQKLAVGNYALVLWPNLDTKGMTIEMRRVDMRDVYPNLNAIAPAPQGETVYRGPARFEAADPLAPRLDMAVAEVDRTVVLTVTYGDRRLTLKFAR